MSNAGRVAVVLMFLGGCEVRPDTPHAATTATTVPKPSPSNTAPPTGSPASTTARAADRRFGEQLFSETALAQRPSWRRQQEPWRVAAERIIESGFSDAADLATAESFRAWQTKVGRPSLQDVLGGRYWSAVELAVDVRVRSVDRMLEFTRVTIDYVVAPEYRTVADLYLPPDLGEGVDEPLPAVLLLHGHHREGGRSMAKAENRENGESSAALDLVRAGYVVLAPDSRGFGIQVGRGPNWDAFHARHVVVENFDGGSAIGTLVADARRGLDVLQAVHQVDPKRIATVGLSLGGQLALFVPALDPRPKTLVIAGYLGSYHSTHLRVVHCGCQYVSGLGTRLDIPDIALLSAPRPALFIAGRNDRDYPIDAARTAFGRIRQGYALVADTPLVELFEHDGGHMMKSGAMLDWLRRTL